MDAIVVSMLPIQPKAHILTTKRTFIKNALRYNNLLEPCF